MDSTKLAAAVRELKLTLDDITDCPNATVSDFENELSDVRGLLSVLANMVEGMPVKAAFGSPGDWGYETQIGKALASRG